MFSYGENLAEGIEDYNRIKHRLYQHFYAIRPRYLNTVKSYLKVADSGGKLAR